VKKFSDCPRQRNVSQIGPRFVHGASACRPDAPRKCDGKIDEGEKTRLIEVLGQASREDVAFVNRELSSPVDVQALIKQVPKGLESPIYAVSLMSIDLDGVPALFT